MPRGCRRTAGEARPNTRGAGIRITPVHPECRLPPSLARGPAPDAAGTAGAGSRGALRWPSSATDRRAPCVRPRSGRRPPRRCAAAAPPPDRYGHRRSAVGRPCRVAGRGPGPRDRVPGWPAAPRGRGRRSPAGGGPGRPVEWRAPRRSGPRAWLRERRPAARGLGVRARGLLPGPGAQGDRAVPGGGPPSAGRPARSRGPGGESDGAGTV